MAEINEPIPVNDATLKAIVVSLMRWCPVEDAASLTLLLAVLLADVEAVHGLGTGGKWVDAAIQSAKDFIAQNQEKI